MEAEPGLECLPPRVSSNGAGEGGEATYDTLQDCL